MCFTHNFTVYYAANVAVISIFARPPCWS